MPPTPDVAGTTGECPEMTQSGYYRHAEEVEHGQLVLQLGRAVLCLSNS